jgi:hypothetical protein
MEQPLEQDDRALSGARLRTARRKGNAPAAGLITFDTSKSHAFLAF